MLAGLFALPAFAQKDGRPSPEEKAKMMTDRMAENLELTSEQKEAVYSANLKMTQKMEESRKKALDENQKQLKKILSEEQYQQMEEMRQEHHKMRKHKPHEMREDRKAKSLPEDPKVD